MPYAASNALRRLGRRASRRVGQRALTIAPRAPPRRCVERRDRPGRPPQPGCTLGRERRARGPRTPVREAADARGSVGAHHDRPATASRRRRRRRRDHVFDSRPSATTGGTNSAITASTCGSASIERQRGLVRRAALAEPSRSIGFREARLGRHHHGAAPPRSPPTSAGNSRPCGLAGVGAEDAEPAGVGHAQRRGCRAGSG